MHSVRTVECPYVNLNRHGSRREADMQELDIHIHFARSSERPASSDDYEVEMCKNSTFMSVHVLPSIRCARSIQEEKASVEGREQARGKSMDFSAINIIFLTISRTSQRSTVNHVPCEVKTVLSQALSTNDIC